MNAVLERDVVIKMGQVIVESDTAHMAIPAGTHTILIPLPEGSMTDITESIQGFWNDLLTSPEVQSIFKKHNVKVMNDIISNP